jgi:hypothetical protein
MCNVQVGNTVPPRSCEYPAGPPISEWHPSTPFELALGEIQVRIQGPGCGRAGVVMFGPHVVGDIILIEDPIFGKVAWKITVEPRSEGNRR